MLLGRRRAPPSQPHMQVSMSATPMGSLATFLEHSVIAHKYARAFTQLPTIGLSGLGADVEGSSLRLPIQISVVVEMVERAGDGCSQRPSLEAYGEIEAELRCGKSSRFPNPPQQLGFDGFVVGDGLPGKLCKSQRPKILLSDGKSRRRSERHNEASLCS
jgi:hypothetical protein